MTGLTSVFVPFVPSVVISLGWVHHKEDEEDGDYFRKLTSTLAISLSPVGIP